jgi:hypothetical protein
MWESRVVLSTGHCTESDRSLTFMKVSTQSKHCQWTAPSPDMRKGTRCPMRSKCAACRTPLSVYISASIVDRASARSGNTNVRETFRIRSWP